MKHPAGRPGADETAPPVGAEATGLPGLRRWGAVYALVFASFLLWLVLLAALSRAYA